MTERYKRNSNAAVQEYTPGKNFLKDYGVELLRILLSKQKTTGIFEVGMWGRTS